MDTFRIQIKPQFVPLTGEKEIINGKECFLHESQKRVKLDFVKLPEITIITAPTGTGKSYAFPFPVLNAKRENKGIDSSEVRGLIVLPTNALIDELTTNFESTYPELVITKLTGPELDKSEKKGLDRWRYAIEIAKNSDLVITNPDILNFAMHGGYHQYSWTKKTGDTRFSSFLNKFNYIIFDEYHLYDEAQIANVLTLIRLRELFLQHYKPEFDNVNGVRFLFVSATPENELKELLKQDNYSFEEIVEEIVESSKNSRPIHGQLEVEFYNCKGIDELIQYKIPELKEVIKNQRVLIILDLLRYVQELSQEFKKIFPNLNIYESTGYAPKNVIERELLKSANIIIATNKAEVGVNYNVDYCIMQPGRYFQNFVQRFGRISRGEQNGKIIIAIDKNYYRIKSEFKLSSEYDYYGFLEIIKNRMQDRRFYKELVPLFIGEYLWCINDRIRRYQDYNVWKYLKTRLNETEFFKRKDAQQYFLFVKIDKLIKSLVRIALRKNDSEKIQLDKYLLVLEKTSPRTFQWVVWWENYIDTYLSFRDNSKTIFIYDEEKNIELEYSLDWILQNKVVKDIKLIQEESFEILKYTVGNLKERDKNIQYCVSTIPNTGKMENSFLSYSDTFDLKNVFIRSVDRIYNEVRKGVTPIDEIQTEICIEVKKLATTFNRKRLKIESIRNNDQFL